jgi:hypothetical protein
MSNYKKFDISIIRNRIKDNAYPTLAGANRAIGKTQGLSEEDKSTLKKYAAKHFGGEAPVAAAPKKKAVAKKVAAPKGVAKVAKAGKKASKKAGKKTAKRVAKAAPAAPATEAEPAPATTEATPAVAKPRRGRAPAAKAKASTKQLELPLEGTNLRQSTLDITTPVAKTALMGNVIGSCTQMLQSITLANNIIPKDAAAAGSEAATKLMTKAVEVLDQDVISPLLAQPEPTKPAPVAAAPKKTPPPRPKNPVVTTKAAPEPPEEPVADDETEDEEPAGDEAGEQEDPPALTEEEERGVAILRDTMPGNLPPGLRVPPPAR